MVFSKSRLNGNILWFHGASVGEVQSIVPLIEKIEKIKISQILITTNTLSSSKIIKKLKFKKCSSIFSIDINFHSEIFKLPNQRHFL